MTDPTPPAPTPPDGPPATAAPKPAPRVSQLSAILTPILCLAAVVAVYLNLSGQIATLRDSQAVLSTTVASLRSPRVDVAGAPMVGDDRAIVTLIEYSDYECPFCIKYFTEIKPRIEADYVRTGRLRYVFRDFPVDELHPAAIKAHEAARCALAQGRFWDMHNRLFSPPGTHTVPALRAQAEQVGLDLASFDRCLAAGETIADIRRTANEASSFGAAGTPAFFLGLYDASTTEVRILRGITGAQPYEVFAQTIDELLRTAG